MVRWVTSTDRGAARDRDDRTEQRGGGGGATSEHTESAVAEGGDASEDEQASAGVLEAGRRGLVSRRRCSCSWGRASEIIIIKWIKS